MLESRYTGDNLVFDHRGYATTNDLTTEVERFIAAFGGEVLNVEAWTSAQADHFGDRSGRELRIRGVLLNTDWSFEEIHQFEPFVPVGAHIAFKVRDGNLLGEMERLATLGAAWFCETPNQIESGPYEGRHWIYGRLGGQIVELFAEDK